MDDKDKNELIKHINNLYGMVRELQNQLVHIGNTMNVVASCVQIYGIEKGLEAFAKSFTEKINDKNKAKIDKETCTCNDCIYSIKECGMFNEPKTCMCFKKNG